MARIMAKRGGKGLKGLEFEFELEFELELEFEFEFEFELCLCGEVTHHLSPRLDHAT